MNPATTTKALFLLIHIGVAALIYTFFWDSTVFSPIRMFFVAVHESFHGLATVLTGGDIVQVQLKGYEGSLTSSGGIVPIITSAGYLGSAFVGAVLLATSFKRTMMILLISWVVYVVVVYTDSYMTKEFFITVGVSLFLLGLTFIPFAKGVVTNLLGTLLAFESIEDVKNYLLHIPGQTDAGILATHFGMPFLAIPIAITFLILSTIIWYIGIKHTFKNV